MRNFKKAIVWVGIIVIMIIFMTTVFDNENKWNGKYVSNIDGYTTVKLKETEKGFEFYIKGSKFGKTFAINNDMGEFEGKIGRYRGKSFGEIAELEFKFEGSDLVIKALTDNMKILEGTYVIDDGTIDEIVYTDKEYVSEIYNYKDIELTITKGENDTIIADFDGRDNIGNFYLGTNELKVKNGIVEYEDDTFGYTEQLKMEFNDMMVNVTASSTDEESLYNRVNGEYILSSKKEVDFKEIKKSVNSINIGVGVTMGL